MENGLNGYKMARPRKEIDQEQLLKLMQLQCTLQEIAGFFDVDERTIERRCHEFFKESFVDVYKKQTGVGKTSLRRLQWKSAQNGNVSMQIWLGKQYLGQTDKSEMESTLKGSGLRIGFEDDSDK